MRIGLFTDTYHPASNGVVVGVDSMRACLEEMGHDVFILAPDGGVVHNRLPDEPGVIRLPAIQYDLQLSLFFPPAILKRIKALDLDIIQFFTPAQIGLAATWAARRLGIVLVGKHSTDTYDYIKIYPAMAISYVFGGFLAPFVVPRTPRNVRIFTKLYMTSRGKNKDESWTQRLVAGLMSLLYSSCDAVVAPSRKSANQLAGFAAREGIDLDLRVIPDGVDLLAPADPGDVARFRERWGIAEDDEVVVNFGRMAEEKNQLVLLRMMPLLLETHPKAKLLLAGDYVYRGKLEQIAASSSAADRIIFTGRYERDQLGTICAVSKVFAFPSVEDTQGFVLNEAAGLGLPIVMCDHDLNDVFADDVNGLMATNSARDFAEKVGRLFDDDALRTRFAEQGVKLAQNFTVRRQMDQLVALFQELLDGKVASCESD